MGLKDKFIFMQKNIGALCSFSIMHMFNKVLGESLYVREFWQVRRSRGIVKKKKATQEAVFSAKQL